ncbi:glycosyltransferase family 8 protein [Pedobacter sp. JCM 36344]|uniref:glycosyltransferase family 8 protein n=1 Tax=Pedobacter sp. JCM 36344 TaxID=3374280 RepID=UPI003977F8FC
MKDNISIVVASDNFYAILIAALLKSIDVNHKTPEHIDFHIIDDGISTKFKKQLETIVDPSRLTIFWHTSKSIIPANLSIPVDTSGFPMTTYLRVFAPNVVGLDVHKLLYIDVDIILQDDISKLWNMSTGEHVIGAIQDIAKTVDCEWGGLPNYKELGLDPKTKYFNAGVLLINTDKWREQNISAEIIGALIKYKETVQLGDQYGLNVVFAQKWQELDQKWNWFASWENENPSLVHFLDIKPIFTTYNSNEFFKKEFFRYLDMTPWKGFKVINGKNRLFRKAFNKLKKAFLRLR